MKKRIVKEKKWLYPALLFLASLLMVLLSWREGSLYGSSCDWFSQHVSIADTIRRTILKEGTLFPGQLPLGGGNNIYDFSYYGYLRPDVLFACLIPAVPMEWIITGYSIGGYLCSVLLFFFLMKKQGIKEEFALAGSVLFLSAGCFFHIHRQIMFVNYMPFLLGAMMCIQGARKRWKDLLLVLMMFFMELHSYYYAIAGLLTLYLFFLYARTHRMLRLSGVWKLTMQYAGLAGASVIMAGALLLPTAASILGMGAVKDGGSAGGRLVGFRWSFEALLYDNYGIGLTLLALFLLFVSLHRKKSRFLAGGLVLCLVWGVVPLVLNGFLYDRPKILMPFLPLVLLLGIETLGEYWQERIKPPLWCLIFTGAAAYLQYQLYETILVFLDLALVSLVYIWMRQNGRGTVQKEGKTMFARKIPSWRGGVFYVLLAAVCGVSYLFGVMLHRGDTLLQGTKAQVSPFQKEERQEFYQKESYRFDSVLAPYQEVNKLLADGAGRTTMYTSTGNKAYSSFFYDEIANPIGNNNRVGLYGRVNPFFQYLMGVRYLETKEEMVPAGYEIRRQRGEAVLAEREDVLPLCYGSCDLLSQEAYDKLAFPENLEALTAKSIVPKEDGQDTFQSHFTRLYPKEGIDFEIRQESETEFTVIPKEPLENQILVIRFSVRQTSRAAVVISMNGVTNKLSGKSAPYPNHNEEFTYMLSGAEPIEEIRIETSGSFEIGEQEVYSLKESFLGNRTVFPLEAQKTSGKEKVKGVVEMPQEGYLITSFPMQKGYRILVDGVDCPLVTVNQTFLGTKLGAGTHAIQILYEPPLQMAGILMSAAGFLLWGAMGVWALDQKGREKVKELVLYGIGGVLTTVVNYLVYFGLEHSGVGYLSANTAAWGAAVAVSYCINRKMVFGSKGGWISEFVPFAGLRLLTLAAENVLLYLLIGQLHIGSSIAKIGVSVITVLGNYMICKKHIFKKAFLSEG